MKQIFKDMTQDLDKPLEISDAWSFLKNGKARIIILYEDLAYKEIYKKLKSDYVITIKGKDYMIIPKCIIRGKYPTLVYYYNNPMPVLFEWKPSGISSKSLYEPKNFKMLEDKMQDTLANTFLDAKAVHVAFTSNLINKMYSENSMTTKGWIVILVVVFIIIILVLHFTGVINIMEILGVAKK